MAKSKTETQGQYESGIKNVEELAGYIPVKSAAAMYGDANENNIGYFIRKGKVDGLRIGGTVLVNKKSWVHYWEVTRPAEEREKLEKEAQREEEDRLDAELQAQIEKLRATYSEKKAAIAPGSPSK